MPSCRCVGDTCDCEAIQVPPKLSFWKKHDFRVHDFLAWIVVLNVTLLGAAPIAILAAGPTQPTVSATASPTANSGVESCLRRCSEETHANECLTRCTLVPQLGLPVKVDKLKKPETKSASSSEEIRKKLEAKKKLETAKKRINEFSRNLASVKSKIAQLGKKGLQAPADLKAAVAVGDALVAKVKAAASLEEIQAMGDIQASMESIATRLKNGLLLLEKQRAALQKFSTIEAQLRSADHQLATAKRLAGDDAALVPGIVAAEKALNDLKAAYRQAHDLITSGDVDGGFKILESRLPDLTKAYQEAMKALHTTHTDKPRS